MKIFIAVFVLIQLIPYGRNHHNPPSVKEPQWDTPETRVLVKQACFDCHSHETGWPWYSHVAPVSWLVQRDVDEGREEVNFSNWGKGRHDDDLEEFVEVLKDKEMPLPIYQWTHPEARISSQQIEQLINSFTAMMDTVAQQSNHDHDHDKHAEHHKH